MLLFGSNQSRCQDYLEFPQGESARFKPHDDFKKGAHDLGEWQICIISTKWDGYWALIGRRRSEIVQRYFVFALRQESDTTDGTLRDSVSDTIVVSYLCTSVPPMGSQGWMCNPGNLQQQTGARSSIAADGQTNRQKYSCLFVAEDRAVLACARETSWKDFEASCSCHAARTAQFQPHRRFGWEETGKEDLCDSLAFQGSLTAESVTSTIRYYWLCGVLSALWMCFWLLGVARGLVPWASQPMKRLTGPYFDSFRASRFSRAAAIIVCGCGCGAEVWYLFIILEGQFHTIALCV